MYNRIFINILIYSSLFIALIMNIMFFPETIQAFKPSFLLLLVLFWIVKEPRHVGIGHAFVCGLTLDVLIGYTIGVRAFAFSLMAYMLCKTFIRMTTYSMLQQCATILLISSVGIVVAFWLEHVFGLAMIDYHLVLSSVSDAVMWPFLCMIMGFFYKFKRSPRENLNF